MHRAITMIRDVCGTPTSLPPLSTSTSTKANAKRSERSGILIDIWLPRRMPDESAHGRVGAFAEAARDVHTDERERRGAEQHPEGEARVDGTEHPVSHRAERLEDRTVEDVGADRDLRVEPEQEDQDRVINEPPPIPVRDPDEQVGERQLPGHDRAA
jgi:hypothetical protein